MKISVFFGILLESNSSKITKLQKENENLSKKLIEKDTKLSNYDRDIQELKIRFEKELSKLQNSKNEQIEFSKYLLETKWDFFVTKNCID